MLWWDSRRIGLRMNWMRRNLDGRSRGNMLLSSFLRADLARKFASHNNLRLSRLRFLFFGISLFFSSSSSSSIIINHLVLPPSHSHFSLSDGLLKIISAFFLSF